MTLPAGWTQHKPGVWRKRVGKIGAEVACGTDWSWGVWTTAPMQGDPLWPRDQIAQGMFCPTRARAIAFCEAVIGVLEGGVMP